MHINLLFDDEESDSTEEGDTSAMRGGGEMIILSVTEDNSYP